MIFLNVYSETFRIKFKTHDAKIQPMTVTMKTPATFGRPSSATPPSPPPPAQAPNHHQIIKPLIFLKFVISHLLHVFASTI